MTTASALRAYATWWTQFGALEDRRRGPDKPQSGMGHAITIGNPLRLHPNAPSFRRGGSLAMLGYSCGLCKAGSGQGAPSQTGPLSQRINHGSNHSINVIYSVPCRLR